MQMNTAPLDSVSLKIHERAMASARRFLSAEVDLLKAIIEVDERRIFERFAQPALTPYCVKVLGLSEETAGCFVRVARKCVQVPELMKALEERRITLFKAKAIASVISRKNPEEWIEKAEKLTKDKLEQAVQAATGKGTIKLALIFTKEQWALFKRARELVSTKLGKTASLEDTLEVLLDYYLEKYDPVLRAQRNQSNSHNDRPQGRSLSESVRIPAAIKHAVNRRDKGRCQARLPDGSTCGEGKWVHFHHLVPKSEGGKDTEENLTTLCSAHHRQWHQAH